MTDMTDMAFDAAGPAAADRAFPTLGEASRVWARIALLSFGGPAGQIAVMHRILVEEKRWLGDGRFLHAPSTGKDVRTDTLLSGYWGDKFMQARRMEL